MNIEDLINTIGMTKLKTKCLWSLIYSRYTLDVINKYDDFFPKCFNCNGFNYDCDKYESLISFCKTEDKLLKFLYKFDEKPKSL